MEPGQNCFSEWRDVPGEVPQSTKETLDLGPILMNDKQIDIVSYAKILGVNVSSDLKWNHHTSEVVKKGRKRLFCLSQLKR